MDLLGFSGPYEKWITRNIVGHCFGTVPTMFSTASLAHVVLSERIPGCLVECGVYAGAEPAIMGHVSQILKKNRDIWLFDSFCGIPKGGPEDSKDITDLVGVSDSPHPEASGVSVASTQSVEANMRSWKIDPSHLNYVKGWFQDTLHKTPTGPIALLRIDVDLYESTRVCLEELYDRVSPGGIVITDDYHLKGCRKAMREYFDGKMPKLTVIPGGLPNVTGRGDRGPAFWRVPAGTRKLITCGAKKVPNPNGLVLSILIPSIHSRAKAHMIPLFNCIMDQVHRLELDTSVEVLTLVDNMRRSIGLKRQALLDSARGKFVAFVDDDDTVSDDYVRSLVSAATSNPETDVIVFDQQAQVDDGNPFIVRFGVELEERDAGEIDGVWFDITRRPSHVCAWRRELAQSCRFTDKNYGEDNDWARQAAVKVNHQVRIERVLHKYRYWRDVTEAEGKR